MSLHTSVSVSLSVETQYSSLKKPLVPFCFPGKICPSISNRALREAGEERELGDNYKQWHTHLL